MIIFAGGNTSTTESAAARQTDGVNAVMAYGTDGQLARVIPGFSFWAILLSAYISGRELFPGKRRIAAFLLILLFISLFFTNLMPLSSFYLELRTKQARFVKEIFQHLRLALSAVGLALIFGIPLGLIRKPGPRKIITSFVNTVQTIPGLALFGLLMVPLSIIAFRSTILKNAGISGIGVTPALIALTLHALLPVVRNTQAARRNIENSVLEAAKGLGLNRKQIFLQVELPLIIPVLLTGIRTAFVQTIGNTTIAALIGAGGLGHFIFQGIGSGSDDMIILGTIPVVVLAISADKLMSWKTVPATAKGIRNSV